MNKASIMELGWGIIHDCISLLVRVLRGKYICSKNHIPQVQAKGKNSPLWKAINLQDLAQVMDGKNVRFWMDI